MHRCWIVQAVMLAIVAPVLLGLLPDLGRSAESMLARDLALSVCSSDSQAPGHGEQHLPVHSESCVLCSICASASSRSLINAVLAFTEPRQTQAPAINSLTVGLRPPQALLLFGSPPRGPPASLLI
jgi:hypothetical protein